MQHFALRASHQTSFAPVAFAPKYRTLEIDYRPRFTRPFPPMNTEELPLFPLARWELPPHLASEPLVAPATARWHGTLWGETTNWLVRVVWEEDFGHVFVCAEERLEEAKWDLALMLLKEIQNQEDLETAINEHLQTHKFLQRRVFNFSSELAHWSLILSDSGWKWVFLYEEDEPIEEAMGEKAPFELNWPFDFLSATPAQIESEVMRAWTDESSDLFYARGWLMLSEEKYARLIGWKRGDEHQFKEMMGLVWCALAPESGRQSPQWAFRPNVSQFSFANWNGNDWYGGAEQPVAFEPWGKALVTWFGPRWNDELTRQHLCANYGGSRSDNHFWVGAYERTSHEQVEAARTLSD